MNKFKFLYGWLIVVCWLIICFGLMLLVFGQTSLFSYLNKLIFNQFGLQFANNNFNKILVWIYSVLGATMAGWGAMMLFILKNAFQKKEKWSWWAILISMGIWFIPDTLISAIYGVFFNVGLNCLILILILLPLSFTYQDIFQDIS